MLAAFVLAGCAGQRHETRYIDDLLVIVLVPEAAPTATHPPAASRIDAEACQRGMWVAMRRGSLKGHVIIVRRSPATRPLIESWDILGRHEDGVLVLALGKAAQRVAIPARLYDLDGPRPSLLWAARIASSASAADSSRCLDLLATSVRKLADHDIQIGIDPLKTPRY